MIQRLERDQTYHFIGIGGIGMSAIAEMLVNLGFRVTGSDINKSYITQKLEEMGVQIYQGHEETNVHEASFVVYSSAITAENPEYHYAQKNKIPLVMRAEMLGELMKLKRGIAIGGTHGKTTTTSILATLLNSRDPGASYIIGGVVKNLGGHSFLGDGEYLVAEADESDGSFVDLSPEVSLVTNIDDDHMNYYQTRRNLEENFLKFINRVPFYGFCVLNGDDKAIVGLLEGVRRPYVTFGLDSDDVDFKAEILTNDHLGCEFQVSHEDQKHNFHIGSSGRHNVYNALGAIAVAVKLGFTWAELQAAMKEFKGVGRRLEVIYSQKQITIFDDYAHHPTEIKAVIESQRKQNKKLYVLFQPHRYTRTQEKWEDFSKCFAQADKVMILPLYSANEEPIDGINSVNLVKDICLNGVDAHWIQNIDDIKKFIDFDNDEMTILSLGAGSISRQIRIFTRELEI